MDWLAKYESQITLGVIGFLGAAIRVGANIGNDQPMKGGTIFATLLSGTLFAALGSSMAASYLGLSSAGTGVAALISGMLGMTLTERVMRINLDNLPIFKGPKT